jgi:hypothetical protein
VSSLHSLTFNSTELHSIILMPQFLNSIPSLDSSAPKLTSWQAGVSKLNWLQRSPLSFLQALGTNHAENTASLLLRKYVYGTVANKRSRRGPHRKHRSSIVTRLRFRWNGFTEPLLRNWLHNPVVLLLRECMLRALHSNGLYATISQHLSPSQWRTS